MHDRNPSKLSALKRRYNTESESSLESAVRRAGVIIVAVRPDCLRGLLREMRGLKGPKLAVSLVAGVPLSTLKHLCPDVRWARAMPSPVCRSAKGLTALTFDRSTSARQRKVVMRFFANVGTVLEIPERQFDAFTVTYSSSHGYHALSVLANAATELGLDRKTAITAAAHALADGIQYWRDSRSSLPSLLHEAATPGGIAGTVMASMDSAGYQKIVKGGLRAGLVRARKNARA